MTDGDEAKGTVTTGSEKQTGCDVFLGTFRQWRYFDQILLIPLTIYNGMQQAFFQSTFMEVVAQLAVVLVDWINFISDESI